MKNISSTTLFSIALLILFGMGMQVLTAAEIPLNQAPWVRDSNTRGQYKQGNLTLGSGGGSSQLTVGGSGIRVEGVNCSAGAFIGSSARPCPYPPFSLGASGTEFRVLGNGAGVGGYIQNLVVGAPSGTAITAQSSLDIRGTITNDPAAAYLNYAPGAYYQNSPTDKRLCALPNGDIIVCGTSTTLPTTNGTGVIPTGSTQVPPSSGTLVPSGTNTTITNPTPTPSLNDVQLGG